jgi:class 3 adenylate cyclase
MRRLRDHLNREELRRIWWKFVTHCDHTPEEEAAWQLYVRRFFVSVAGVVWALLCVLTVVTWPIESVIFRDDPEMHFFVSAWRVVFLVPSIGAFLLLAALKPLRRRPFLVIATAGCFSTAGWGYFSGLLGGLDANWFYAIYYFPVLTVFFAVPIVARVGAAFAVSASALLGFFIPFPEYFAHPHLGNIVTSVGMTVLISVLIGHTIYHLSRSNYFHEIALEEAKAEIEKEREKSERLLLNILPEPISERLKAKQESIADGFEEATVLFADVVNFTPFSETLLPEELVEFLNRVFSKFDELVGARGLEKIKTIGDAYMVAGGLPEPREDHAQAMAELALEMAEAVRKFEYTDHRPLEMRIGINTGPVVAGVIGVKKFIYDLWGDTVNTASRMESHGMGGEIQVTRATYEKLKDEYVLEPRGTIPIKGKGELETWLLKGKKAAGGNAGRWWHDSSGCRFRDFL